MQEFVALASHLADEAGKIARQYFRADFDIISKADTTPVTIADKTIEKHLRSILADQRPDDTILGEELDNTTGSSGYTWIIDPIDGTQSFIMGRPTFGTLIALWQGDTPLIGIIDQPISNERWIGVSGQPTTFNSAPVTTRPCKTLDEAIATSTTPAMFTGKNEGIHNKFMPHCKYGWGGDCYSYGLLASGFIDLVIESDLKPHDFAPLLPIIQGAGGHICDFQGNPITLKSSGDVVAVGDKTLWPSVQEKINEHLKN